MELDSIEELNRLEKQIQETQKFLEKNSNDKNLIQKLKQQRIVISIFAFLFLLFGLWAYFYNQDIIIIKKTDTALLKSNLVENQDSIKLYKDFYQNRFNLKPEVNLESNINNDKVLYYVQFAAIKGLDTKIVKTMKIKHRFNNGYSKFLIGNFSTYEEALDLRFHLKKFGFKDSFITAELFGEKIKIKQALALSNEEILIK